MNFGGEVASDNNLPLHCILTDVAEVVPLLDINILLNVLLAECAEDNMRLKMCHGDSFAKRSDAFKQYTAMPHFWGESTEGINRAIGRHVCESSLSHPNRSPYRGVLVVASDVVYDPTGYEPLVTTISSLLHYHNILFQENIELSSASHVEPPMMVLAHRQRNLENIK